MTLIDRLRFEPAMVAAGILAALAFAGVTLTDDHASLLSQLVIVAGPLIAGIFVRAKVVPVAKVAAAAAAVAAVVVDPPELP